MPTPSLIIPSAPVYDEGNLYGLNVYGTQFFPEAIPFTRATTATRTNAAGLVELVPYNLVSYSEQFENAAWTKTNASVTANTTTSPSGLIDADKLIPNATFGVHNAIQAFSIPSSTAYTVSVYAKKAEYSALRINYISSGNTFVSVNLDTGVIASAGGTIYLSSSIANVGNGWYRITMTFTPPVAANALNFIVENPVGITNFSGNGADGIYLWGAQLVEGTSALPYLKTETRLNRPRVDFSLGGCPNLLLEPQRTNRALWSEDLTNAVWTNNTGVTITPNVEISPSGTLTADRVQFTSGGNRFVYQTIYGVSAGSTITFSGWFRCASGTQVIGFNDGTANPNAITITTAWQRFTFTFNMGSSIGFQLDNYYGLTPTQQAKDFFVWGLQAEVGAYATSYIPTTTATVTRNADSFTESNIFSRGMITAAGGTWFVELRNNIPLVRDASGGELYIGEDANSAVAPSKQSICIRNSGGATPIRLSFNYWNGAAVVQLFTTSTNTCKIAIKFTATSYDVFINGVKVLNAQPISWTLANVQNLNGLAGVQRFINSMALYPTPLSDTECINLTTL